MCSFLSRNFKKILIFQRNFSEKENLGQIFGKSYFFNNKTCDTALSKYNTGKLVPGRISDAWKQNICSICLGHVHKVQRKTFIKPQIAFSPFRIIFDNNLGNKSRAIKCDPEHLCQFELMELWWFDLKHLFIANYSWLIRLSWMMKGHGFVIFIRGTLKPFCLSLIYI